jgi:hypothetical protein
MWNAAIHSARLLCAAAAIAFALQAVGAPARAAGEANASSSAPIRGLVVDGRLANKLGANALHELKHAGLNTLLLVTSSLTGSQKTALDRRAAAEQLHVLDLVLAPGAGWRAGDAGRACARRLARRGTCAIVASLDDAASVTRDRGVSVVGLRVNGLQDVARLKQFTLAVPLIVPIVDASPSHVNATSWWPTMKSVRGLGIASFALTALPLDARGYGVVARMTALSAAKVAGDAANKQAPATGVTAATTPSVPAVSGSTGPVASTAPKAPASPTTPNPQAQAYADAVRAAAAWWTSILGPAYVPTPAAASPSPPATLSSAPTPAPSPTGTAASVWVSTTGDDRTCVRGDASKPCATFNKAYTLATGGDTVEVAAGTYPSQTLSQQSKGTSVISFRPASAGTVTLANLSVNTSYVVLTGFSFLPGTSTTNGGGIDIEGTGSSRVSNVMVSSVTGASRIFLKGSYIVLKDGVFGPYHACLDSGEDGVVIGAFATSPNWTESDHITLDNVTVHDIDRWNNPGIGAASGTCADHTDALQTYGGQYITIKNSHFYRNATSNILARPTGGDILDHWLVENNMFGPTLEGGNDVMIGAGGDTCGGINDFVVQYNEVSSVRLGCAGAPATVRANLLAGGAQVCSGAERNGVYTYNAFGIGTTDSACIGSLGSRVCNASYADTSRSTSGNYDLSAGDTCAKRHGDPANFPARDIHGSARPLGTPPDVGPDQSP